MIINYKIKNIEITVGISKKVSDIAVICGLDYYVDKRCLSMLTSNHSCDKVYDGAESAAMGYALFETIRDKMSGSPLELARSKVSQISCDSIDEKFVITFNTQGSISALRKNIGIILSSLAVHKLFTKYSENIKMLKGKADRLEFNHYANELSDSIKKSIKFAVIGRIKTTKEKVVEMLDKVQTKLQMSDHEKGSKPEKHDVMIQEFPEIKTSGITAIVVADYILSKSGGMGVTVDNVIIVHNKLWETKKKSLESADRIKDYVHQKYEKLDTDFALVIGYSAITRHLANCCTIVSLIKSNPKPATMIALIQKALK